MLKAPFLKKVKSPVSLTLILLTVILLFCDYNFRWKKEQWKYAVNTDAAHYYGYLPMVFIHHQLDDPAENPSVIKYYCGTALLYLPFFGIACAGSAASGLPVDGYSMLFPILISIGTLFYLMFGLHFFSKFLRWYISKSWIICVVLGAITFGTVAFYYTVNSPGWAHIVAFGLICFLLYHFKKITIDFNKRSIIAIIAASSFLFFVRPTDVVILVAAPFFARDFNTFISIFKRVFREKKAIFTGILLALIPLLCQLAIYKSATGHFLVWSYTKEGFHFLHPQFRNELFSYAKGFFVYTPICFLALFGFFRLYPLNRYLFFGIGIYIALNIYIISSWWCWNYGYSYGPRAFIEHYPLFFFLLALLLDIKNKIFKTIMIALIFLLCLLNLFQIYQTLNGILDQDFKTDKKGYWDVFLRTDRGYSGKFYRYPVDDSKDNMQQQLIFYNDMETKDTAWLNSNTQVNEVAHSGRYASKVNKDSWYSTCFRKRLSEVPYNKNAFIRASGWFFVPKRGNHSYFAISYATDGKSINFNPFDLDGYTQHFNQWEFHVFEMYMPKFPKKIEEDPTAQIEFYYFNNSATSCYVDDLKIEFIEYKKMDRVLDLSWE